MEDIKDIIIGKDITWVKSYLKEQGIEFRYIKVDGFPMVVTCDYKPERVNLCITDDVVTNISFG